MSHNIIQTLNLNQDGSRTCLRMVYQEYMNTPFRLEYDIAINLIMINFFSHYRSRCPNCQLQIPAAKFEMVPGKYTVLAVNRTALNGTKIMTPLLSAEVFTHIKNF